MNNISPLDISFSLLENFSTLTLNSPSMPQSKLLKDNEPSSSHQLFDCIQVAENVTSDLKSALKIKSINKEPISWFQQNNSLDSTFKLENTDETNEQNAFDKLTKSNNNDKNSLKSVPFYIQSTLSKKSVSWKPKSKLAKISYLKFYEFERDIRAKTIEAMLSKNQAIRTNYLGYRSLKSLDIMEPKTNWHELDDSLLIEIPQVTCINGNRVYPGSKDRERMIKRFYEDNYSLSNYVSAKVMSDTPAEPNNADFTSKYHKPLMVPMENLTEDESLVYKYLSWPTIKDDMNSLSNVPKMLMDVFQNSGYGGNSMNWNMLPNNPMGMGPDFNYMKTYHNQMMNMQNQIAHYNRYHLPVIQDITHDPYHSSIQQNQYWHHQTPPNYMKPPYFVTSGRGSHDHTTYNYSGSESNENRGMNNSSRGSYSFNKRNYSKRGGTGLNRSRSDGINYKSYDYSRSGRQNLYQRKRLVSQNIKGSRSQRKCKYFKNRSCFKVNCEFLHE